jgi:hypothetical protein
MTSVADAGRGNYEFMAGAMELARFLGKELDEAAATVCDRVVAKVTLPDGMRLVRAYGAESDGTTGTVTLPFGALFGGDSRRAILQLSVQASDPGKIGSVGVEVDYRTVADGSSQEARGQNLAIHAVSTEAQVAESRDMLLFARAKSVVIDSSQKEAFEAWRRGNTQQAQAITSRNRASILSLGRRLQSAGLGGSAAAEGVAELEDEYADNESTFAAQSARTPSSNQYRLEANQKRRARALRSN